MALDSILEELLTQQRRLQESLLQLRLTIAEDHPVRNAVLLVDQFEYAVDDSLGWMEQAIAAASEAQQSTNLAHVGKSLGVVNDAHLKIVRHYWNELASYGRMTELMRFGKQRGGEWRAWTKGVKAALDQQVSLLDQIGDAILHCWLELIGQTVRKSILVQASSVGQQITVPASFLEVGPSAAS